MKNRKVFCLTGIAVLVSFILAAVVSILSMDKIVDSYQKELTLSITSQIYNEIGIELSGPIIASQTMSKTYFLKQYLEDPDFPGTPEDEQQIIRYLDSIKNGLNYNTAFVISDKNGNYYTMNGFNKKVDPVHDAHDIWYQLFVDSGLTYDFDVDVDEVHNNAWSVFINSRVENENQELLGVCGVGVDMTYLQNILKKHEDAYNIKVNLVNQDGLVQIDTDTINIETAVLEEAVATFDQSSDYTYQKMPGGGYMVSKYIANFDWYLVVSSDDSNASEYLSTFVMLGVAFLGLLIVLIGCLFVIIKKDRKALIHASEVDDLTGLYNKSTFMNEARVQAAQAENVPYSFVFIDADNFKEINDTLGHSIGDQAIRKVTEVIQNVFGQEELIGRFGGDEFVVFLKNTPENMLMSRLEKLNQEARLTFRNGQDSVSISVSIGAVLCSEKPFDDFAKLVNMADEELYKSKKNGRDQYHLRNYTEA